MATKATPRDIVGPGERLIMIAGGYGSGKTEISVNLALRLADRGIRVALADLDIVNPYFRCREARAILEMRGVRVVVPPGSLAWADLPIILPELRGLLAPAPGAVTIFDVGGDDVGARALGALRPAVGDRPCELWQVVNAKRPFTTDVASCLALQRAMEQASRFTVTGLVANAHLIDETTPEIVLEGWELTRAVARRCGLPVRGVAVLDALADAAALGVIDVPLLRLVRRMAPPWIATAAAERLPAARPVPLGRTRDGRPG